MEQSRPRPGHTKLSAGIARRFVELSCRSLPSAAQASEKTVDAAFQRHPLLKPITICQLHHFFVLPVSHPFTDCGQNGHRAAERETSQNGEASNRDKLPRRSLTVAQAVLDRLELRVAVLALTCSGAKPNQASNRQTAMLLAAKKCRSGDNGE